MEIGGWYAAREFGSPTPLQHAIECIRRYGDPGVLSDGTQLSRIAAPLRAEIGNLSFMTVMGLQSNPLPIGTNILSIDGFGLMGLTFRQSGGSDPVVWNGSAWMLDLSTSVLFPIEGHIGLSGHGLVSADIPIPNDPSLVGAVALFQFGIADGSTVVLSEVIGVKLTNP
jgi:hypothetical protein